MCQVYKAGNATKETVILLENKSFKIKNESIKKDFLKVFELYIKSYCRRFQVSVTSIFDLNEALKMNCKVYDQMRIQYEKSIESNNIDKIKSLMVSKIFFDF